MTLGSDGNLWFSEGGAARGGRITTTGVITEFSLPAGSSGPSGITLGSDGNVWVLVKTGRKVDRITPAGVITEFAVPDAVGTLLRLTSGPFRKAPRAQATLSV